MPSLPKIDDSLQAQINAAAIRLLNLGQSPDSYEFLGNEFKLQFENISHHLKNIDMRTIYSDLYPKEIEITLHYLLSAMANLHLQSLTDQKFFFDEIDKKSSDLTNVVIRNGDKWGLVETKHLTKKFPLPWQAIDNLEIHIHQIIPGSINSSLWLSELLGCVSQENIFIRPDIFRLNPIGTSTMRMERAASYGKPFRKEWLKSLKKVEIAEHAPNPDNPLEQGYRTQFIWEPLPSQEKVQFAIEELPDGDDESICTRFIHGIYDITLEKFEHFDGAIHIYSQGEYQKRKMQHLKDHNNQYLKAKIFLIDTGITIEQGEKLISAFYRWNTMPTEYFTHSSSSSTSQDQP